MAWPIVIDSCVLVPGGLRDDLLSIAAEGLFRPVWSSEILVEVGRTLGGPRFTLRADAVAHLLDEMRATFPHAGVDGWESRVRWVPDAVDAQDRHVVAAALAAEARIIVTVNTRHFATHGLASSLGIEVKRPDDFLVDQWTISPRRAANGVRRQIARIGRTPQEHVAAVLPRLPQYAEMLALDIGLLGEPR